jgi:hypothetical protein
MDGLRITSERNQVRPLETRMIDGDVTLWLTLINE